VVKDISLLSIVLSIGKLPYHFRTASTRIKIEEWQKYNEKLAKKGITPFTDIKNHIESVLKDEPNRELGKNGISNREEPKEIPREAGAESGPTTNNWFW